MKKFVLYILFSAVSLNTFSIALNSSDSTLIIENKVDSFVTENNPLDTIIDINKKDVVKDNVPSENGMWFMYGFLLLGAVLVILKFSGRV